MAAENDKQNSRLLVHRPFKVRRARVIKKKKLRGIYWPPAQGDQCSLMFSKRTKRKINKMRVQAKKIVAEMAMTKDKKVELDRTHTKGRGCERLFYCIRVDPRRSEGERKTKNCWGRAKKGEEEGLGSSQSGGTGQKVLIRKRDGLMRLLARRDFMIMMMTVLDSLVNWAYKSSWVDLGGLINEGGGGIAYIRGGWKTLRNKL